MQDTILFIKKIHKYFIKKDKDIDLEKQTLLRSMKLSEEVGELNEQILLHYGYGRKEKYTNYSQENLELELADVIFSTLMIAESLGIDMNTAIDKKTEILRDRFEKQHIK